MKRAVMLAIISLMVTPVWIGVLVLRPTDSVSALVTFIEVCSIGTFSLGFSEVLGQVLHPEQH